jgi:hypothetical protein
MLDKDRSEKPQAPDHDLAAGPMSFDGAQSYDSGDFEGADSTARARYSFHAEVRPFLLDVRKETLIIVWCSTSASCQCRLARISSSSKLQMPIGPSSLRCRTESTS